MRIKIRGIWGRAVKYPWVGTNMRDSGSCPGHARRLLTVKKL
jgi:hypothetical protein